MIRFALIGLAGLAYKTAQAQPLPYPTSQSQQLRRESPSASENAPQFIEAFYDAGRSPGSVNRDDGRHTSS